MKYIKGLDSLRAFAVLAVLVGHWGLPFSLGSTGDHILTTLIPTPQFGVHLFFVLSGFLITNILLDAAVSGERKLTIMRNFVVRRSLRIFPIYYLTIISLTAMGFPYMREHLGWFLTYTTNIMSYKEQGFNPLFHTWSLSVEEQFYLVWPWLIIFVNPRYIKSILYGSIITGLAVTLYFRFRQPPNEFGILLMPACLHAFGIGGLYAWTRRQGSDKLASFMKVINFLLPVALIFHFYWNYTDDRGHINYWIRTKDCILSIWLIHYVMTVKTGWIKTRVLENPVLIRIGRISYGIYLYHYFSPHLYNLVIQRAGISNASPAAFLMNDTIKYFINLGILAAMSVCSFEYIEKPILSLKRYFEYKEPKRAAERETSAAVVADADGSKLRR